MLYLNSKSCQCGINLILIIVHLTGSVCGSGKCLSLQLFSRIPGKFSFILRSMLSYSVHRIGYRNGLKLEMWCAGAELAEVI